MSKRQYDHMKLDEALKAFVDENRLQKGLDKIDVIHAWESIMGQGVNRYTTSVELRGEILYVHLSSSVLREELSYGKTKIIEIMNEALGRPLIKTVVLR